MAKLLFCIMSLRVILWKLLPHFTRVNVKRDVFNKTGPFLQKCCIVYTYFSYMCSMIETTDKVSPGLDITHTNALNNDQVSLSKVYSIKKKKSNSTTFHLQIASVHIGFHAKAQIRIPQSKTCLRNYPMLSVDSHFWLVYKEKDSRTLLFDVISMMYLIFDVTDDITMVITTMGRLIWCSDMAGSIIIFCCQGDSPIIFPRLWQIVCGIIEMFTQC